MNQPVLESSCASGQLIMNGQDVTMNPLPTVSQLVAARPPRARVFEKWGIPYCCGGGNASLDVACSQRGIELGAVQADLVECDRRGSALPLCAPANWPQAPLGGFIDHIVEAHHQYLRAELPRLSSLLHRVADKHGTLFPEIWELQGLFEEFKNSLEQHLDKEEQTLFPLLKRLEASSPWLAFPAQGRLANPICLLEMEHAFLRDDLSKLREWTHDFTPPEAACGTYRVLLHSLAELEIELIRHMSEEEDILFPRALSVTESQV